MNQTPEKETQRIEWKTVESGRPFDGQLVALMCLDITDMLVSATGWWNGRQNRWALVAKPDTQLKEIVYWCVLPDNRPSYHEGDAIS